VQSDIGSDRQFKVFLPIDLLSSAHQDNGWVNGGVPVATVQPRRVPDCDERVKFNRSVFPRSSFPN
jgi:hypothetical protein